MRITGNRVAATLVLALGIVVAGPAAAEQPRILVVGDSWAVPLYAFALPDALSENGLGEYGVVGSQTAIGGTRADQWATAPYLNLITQALQANPTVDVVHLSMGGNDVLPLTPIAPEDLPAVMAQLFDHIDTVVAHVLSIRPEARVVLCGYDYIQEASLNELLAAMAATAVARSALNPNYYYINNYGLMQYTYGYPGQFQPGEVPLPGGYPDYEPLMGGDPAFPSPAVALNDPIHLTEAGYDVLAARCVDQFYVQWLTAPAPHVPASGRQAATVLVTTLLLLGYRRVRALPSSSRSLQPPPAR